MLVAQAKKQALSGNYAVAYAVKQVDVDVIAAYPITPQVSMVEKLSEYVADGLLDAEFIPVESEHSAISVVTAAAAAGARVFTATSSQGLALMHEILFITSSLRLPVVMAVGNRALSAPINIWNDISDSMAQRDTGWIQFYAESAQEVYDTMIQAYKIAENSEVRLPVMVNLDGYILTHTYEPVYVLPDEVIRSFVPRVDPPYKLHPDNPIAVGTLGPPEYYYEIKYQQIKAMEDSLRVIKKVANEYYKISGRLYKPLEPSFTDDADTILISIGAVSTTSRFVVKRLREKGMKVGLLKIRLFRPFPYKELIDIISNAKAIGVMDRAVSPGAIAGPLYLEVAASVKYSGINPLLIDFVAGLGGRDIRVEDIELMFRILSKIAKRGRVEKPVEYIGLRGWEVSHS